MLRSAANRRRIEDTAGMTPRSLKKSQSWKEWHDELTEKLEAVHNLAVEADAFHGAFEAIYGDTAWPSDGDPERRRALNRMSCFVDQLTETLDALLRESQEAVEIAMKRAS
jgi:hypothetical protein